MPQGHPLKPTCRMRASMVISIQENVKRADLPIQLLSHFIFSPTWNDGNTESAVPWGDIYVRLKGARGDPASTSLPVMFQYQAHPSRNISVNIFCQFMVHQNQAWICATPGPANWHKHLFFCDFILRWVIRCYSQPLSLSSLLTTQSTLDAHEPQTILSVIDWENERHLTKSGFKGQLWNTV